MANSKQRAIAATVISIIICVLWYNAKFISTAQAQDSNTKAEYVYRILDTSAAQESQIGSGMYVANDIDAHPELIYVDTIISKQSPKGIILKYLVIYRKR